MVTMLVLINEHQETIYHYFLGIIFWLQLDQMLVEKISLYFNMFIA
uniref:Uncharacterized protein n=1 Tax=Arundo donax TaxID=35708 RepID=A0A0A9B3E1_ARUDO